MGAPAFIPLVSRTLFCYSPVHSIHSVTHQRVTKHRLPHVANALTLWSSLLFKKGLTTL